MTKKTEEVLPYLSSFLLDSGAFTFSISGKKTEWRDYVKLYADYIKANGIKDFFELDVDSLIGYEKVLDLRHLLEDMTGTACIPVWHKSRGKEAFEKMCEEYRHVSVGGIVAGEIKRNEYPAFTKLIQIAHKNGCQIHGLGFTNLTGIKKYHFDSVDSTGWLAGNKYGFIYNFDGSNLKKQSVPHGHRLGKTKWSDARLHNLREWRKFADYAEIKL